jgi:hypothetical protein
MDTEDVGGRDFMFGTTGILAIVVIAVLFAILS